MDAIKKKSLETQIQVRNNAEEIKNSLNNLYSWEKEIKEKEIKLLQRKQEEHLKTLPVRSHILDKETTTSVTVSNGKTATTPVEKTELPTDPNGEKRKRANDVKDRGNKHVKLGEYEKAIKEYTIAIDIFPEDAVFYSNRALCYLKLKLYDDCIQDCDCAVQIDKMAVKAFYRRMQANESLGNDMDALKDCTSVLMIEPKNLEAKKSLERINQKLRQNGKSANGPNFSALKPNQVEIWPIEKPAYKRSTKPLKRVEIDDVVGPNDSKNFENTNLKISDEDIDKLFNSNCGPFVEVKKKPEVLTKASATTVEEQKKKTSAVTATKKSSSATNTAAITKQSNSKDIQEEIIVDSNKLSSTAVAKKVEATEMPVKISRPVPPAPTSTAQFYSNWKELQPAQKYQYLKSIEISHLCRILGAGFDSDTLTDVMRTLCDYYLPYKEAATSATLLEVSKNNQVAILSLLMSTDDRKALSEILNSIKATAANANAVELIAKNFNLH